MKLKRTPVPFSSLAFHAVIESAGAEVKVGAFRSPNTNAFVERFIQTIQQECLDHFVVFGEQHMDHLVEQFVTRYHEERPHQGIGNALLARRGEPDSEEVDAALRKADIQCTTRLCEILKHYSRAA